MKKILLVATQYRTGERIYSTIPKLAELYKLDVLRIYQMHPSYKWSGSINMVEYFMETYGHYFENSYTGINDPDYEKYDLIIFDDNREKNELDEIYLKRRNCPIVACEHGNRDLSKLDSLRNRGVVFDYGFVFGNKTKGDGLIPVGIPSNDSLKDYTDIEKTHILIIVNFLGNRQAPFKRFDKELFHSLPLKELQEYYNVPILIKLKSRNDEGGYKHNVDYLKEALPAKDFLPFQINIAVDVKDDNKLIAASHCVISAPSTLAFKSIQLGIPTVLLKGYGQVGLFNDFNGLMNVDRNRILHELINQTRQSTFIENTIEGGLTFNSTDTFIAEVNKLCEK